MDKMHARILIIAAGVILLSGAMMARVDIMLIGLIVDIAGLALLSGESQC